MTNTYMTSILENKAFMERTGRTHTTTVNGEEYKWWGDVYLRSTFAENENGEIKAIKKGGYVTTDLSVRKAISYAFNTGTFRK